MFFFLKKETLLLRRLCKLGGMESALPDFSTEVFSSTTELSFADLPGLRLTEIVTQNGENPQLHPKLVRVWTHDAVAFANDLDELSMHDMRTKFKDRATRNYVQPNINFTDLLQHEASPDVRVKPVTHESKRHMLADLKLCLDEPLGMSSLGKNYVARLDVVVVTQTPRSFLMLNDLQRLSKNANLDKNCFVEFYFLCASEAMALDTAAECSDWGAQLQIDGNADRFIWHCLIPSERTILGVMKRLHDSPTKSLFFQSCRTDRENLTMKLGDDDSGMWFRLLARDNKVLPLRMPERGSLLLCDSFAPFVPVTLLRVGTVEESFSRESLKLTYNDFDGNVHTIADRSGSTLDLSSLQSYVRCASFAAAALQYVSRALLPQLPEYIHVLGPSIMLTKQLSTLKPDAPAIVRETLESALSTLTSAKECLFPDVNRQRARAILLTCSPLLTKVDVAYEVARLKSFVNEDFDAGFFSSPPTFGVLYPFLRAFDPSSIGRLFDTNVPPAPTRNISVNANYTTI